MSLQKDNAHLASDLENSIQENKDMIEQFENYRTRKEEHIIVLLNNIKKIQKDFKIIKASYEEDMSKSHEKIKTLTQIFENWKNGFISYIIMFNLYQI